MIKEGKILIFHLSRFGYANYAAGMIDHLPLDNCLIYLSEYHSIPVRKPFTKVQTYRNGFEFIWSSLTHLPLFLWRLSQLAKKQNAKVAYFLGFHYWDLPIILVCKACCIRVVYTVHDGILHEGEQFWMHRILQNACIRSAVWLIFLTEYMRRETLRTLKISKSTIVIPHGPVEIPDSFVKRSHSPHLKLLFLGRISKYKGIENLLKAVLTCDNNWWEYLTIAGKPLYQLEVPRHSKIKLISRWLSEVEIGELLRSHDVLILPYASATQSGVITLGISAAIPIICTKVGGIPEQLAENEAIWVNYDANELSNAIRLLSCQPSTYEALYSRLIERKKQFHWQEPAMRIADLLTKLRTTCQ